MGNQLVGAAPGQILSVENYLNELPANFQTGQFIGLGSTRFFKVGRIPHEEGLLVVKLLIKPDASLQLKPYGTALQVIRDSLGGTHNCLPFHAFYETDRLGILIRQYIRDSLYDRISTRPFLSSIEKLWILFQLLKALKEAHDLKVCHGDIKTENVMVTSWNWVMLTDFASFKPTYLPEDDPSDFSFFFDTAHRRVCYIAPERFLEVKRATAEEPSPQMASPPNAVPIPGALGKSDDSMGVGVQAGRTSSSVASTPPFSAKVAIHPSGDGDMSVMYVAGKEVKSPSAQEHAESELTPKMDIFSLGCVLAELFCDGIPLFDLSQLLAYRHGLYDPKEKLSKISNPVVVELILDMIAVDPAKRLSAHDILTKYKGTAFPNAFFHFLYPYCSRFSGEPILTADDRIGRLRRDLVHVFLKRVLGHPTPGASSPPSALTPDEAPSSSASVTGSSSEQQLAVQNKYAGGKDCLVVIISVLTSSLRHCCSFQAKLSGLELLTVFARHCGDTIVLERLVPYMTQLLSDDVPEVQAAALRALTTCTKLVKQIPGSDANLFPEYILPAVQLLASPESDLRVRISLAENIVVLAETALRFLEASQIAMNEQMTSALAEFMNSGSATESLQSHTTEGTYDAELLALHEMMQKPVVALLCDPVNTVKRTLLENGISQLCIFFGRQKANDVLLSHMITFQNDKHDWQLRGAFFDSIVEVAAYVGTQSLSMVMPLLQQGLADVEETVVYKALEALRALCALGLFHRKWIQTLSPDILPFLCHPNKWLRYAAVGFVISMAKNLTEADIQCILLPSLSPYLHETVIQLEDEVVLLTHMKPPVPRQVYDTLVRQPSLDEFFTWLERRSSQRRLNKPHLSYDPMKISQELQALLDSLDPLTDMVEGHLWRIRDFLIKMRRSFSGPQDSSNYGAGSGRPGVLQADANNIRFANLRSSDSHTPLNAAALQLPKSTPSKKNAVTPSDTPAMSEEWNQMFGSGRSGGTLSRSSKESAPSDKTTSRRGELRKRNRSESNTAKTHPLKSRKSMSRSASRGAILPGDGAGAAASPAPPSTSSSQSLDDKAEVSASASAATPGNAAAAPPTSHKHTHFLLPDSQGKTSRSQCEDRPRECREGLKKLLDHRRDQYEQSVTRMEELSVVRTSEGSGGSPGWVPKGIIVAHMQEHRSAVNKIVVADDDSLFATCSNDSTVRVWDCAKLRGRSVLPHKSVLTYNKQEGRILSVLFLDPTRIVSASTDGSMHVVSLAGEQRLHAIRQPSPDLTLDKDDLVNTMHQMNNGTLLVNTTLHGRIIVWDLRSGQIAWSEENPLEAGLITSSAVDVMNCWLAVGTISGVHVCWDMRFRLPVTQWTHPANLPVEQMAAHPLHQSQIISATCGNNEVSVWNMQNSTRTQAFWGCSGQPLVPNRVSNHYIRALCTHPSLGGGSMLLGSSDRRVRLFNMAKPLESALILSSASVTSHPSMQGSQNGQGNLSKLEKTVGKYRKLQCDGVEVLQEQLKSVEIKQSEDAPRRGLDTPAASHIDSITSLAVTNAGQNFLLSGSRDGVVKVWK